MYYFDSFPLITYNNNKAVDITRRAIVSEIMTRDQTAFYPYTLRDGETADSLAYDYYGDPNYVWLIYFVNNIIDPYYDWSLTVNNFEKYIINKYGSIAAAQSQIVYYKKLPTNYYVNNDTNEFILASLYDPAVNGYNWTLFSVDDDIRVNVVRHILNTEDAFELITEDGYTISTENSIALDPAVWQPIDAYTDEVNKNEEKKNILLLSSAYASQISNQLNSVLNA
jgi:hypothetical protein